MSLLAIIQISAMRSAQAGVITSASDPALAGAVVERFDYTGPGTFTNLATPVTQFTNTTFNAPEANNEWGTRYVVPPGNATGALLFWTDAEMVFDMPVTAFLFNLWGYNRSGTVRVYDSNNSLLHSFNHGGVVATVNLVGFAAPDIARLEFDGTGSEDAIVIDDLYMAGIGGAADGVPTPMALALIGAGLAGVGVGLRGRKHLRPA